jgi:hypothetical protein
MTAEPHLELNFANGFEEDRFKEVAEDLRAGGADVALRRRPPEGPWASLHWLIPTAVILLFAKPYLEGFFTETGKLHADGLHKALSKLWNKVFGPKPEITYTIVGSSGNGGSEVFSHAFSVRSTRNDGGEAILLIPSATSLEDFSLAVDRFVELMGKHYALSGADPLTRTMALVSYLDHPNFPALVYMNPETKSLELIDYVRSSQARKLTTHQIPQ